MAIDITLGAIRGVRLWPVRCRRSRMSLSFPNAVCSCWDGPCTIAHAAVCIHPDEPCNRPGAAPAAPAFPRRSLRCLNRRRPESIAAWPHSLPAPVVKRRLRRRQIRRSKCSIYIRDFASKISPCSARPPRRPVAGYLTQRRLTRIEGGYWGLAPAAAGPICGPVNHAFNLLADTCPMRNGASCPGERTWLSKPLPVSIGWPALFCRAGRCRAR